MAVPVLKVNLAPAPTFWRQRHELIGWVALLTGTTALILAGSVSFLAYREAQQAGRDAVLSTEGAQAARQEQAAIQNRLRAIDVDRELPLWRVAERILRERSHPWSRLTAELERSLVQDVRLRSIQRGRSSKEAVELKIQGEARSRAAEEAFVQALQNNPFFAQVVLEREADRQGGGIDFAYTLLISEDPPPYVPLPKYGPPRPVQPAILTPQPAPSRPAPPAPPRNATPAVPPRNATPAARPASGTPPQTREGRP